MTAAASHSNVGPERASALAVAAAAGGAAGEPALAALYDEVSDKLWQWISRQVRDYNATEDIHSDTWLAAIQAIATYDPQRGGVLAWMHKIAERKIADHFRSINRRRTQELAASLVAGDVDYTERAQAVRRGTCDGPADHAATAASREKVRDVLAGLPAACRDALLLTVFDGLSNAEAAAELGIKENAVKQNRYRGLCHLKADGMEIAAKLIGEEDTVVHTVNADDKSEAKRLKR